jgi:HAD superfamily hydrolase (TIGR01509 family)
VESLRTGGQSSPKRGVGFGPRRGVVVPGIGSGPSIGSIQTAAPGRGVIAVVFDLDGVLIDSEQTWDEARRRVVEERGGRWRPEATTAMMGMSSPEWSQYLHDRLGVPGAPEAISDAVVALVLEAYDQRLPLLPGARETVQTLAKRWPLGLASSSNRVVIEVFLERSGLRGCFRAVVSSEEVAHGKPAPDVYLAAVAALAVEPHTAVAVEDSSNGIRAASAAATRVVAIANRAFPPPADVLALADVVLASVTDLTPDLVTRLAGEGPSEPPDR